MSAAQHRDSYGRLVNLVAVAGRDHHDQHNDALSLWLYDLEQDDFLMVQVSSFDWWLQMTRTDDNTTTQ